MFITLKKTNSSLFIYLLKLEFLLLEETLKGNSKFNFFDLFGLVIKLSVITNELNIVEVV